jgi:hypothetical protein
MAASHLAAQAPGPIVPPPKTPPQKPTLRDETFPIVVSGCVRGSRLKIDPYGLNVSVQFLNASEFVLEGTKELMRRIEREHEGHEDEITGIAIVPAPEQSEDGHTQTKTVGKTRITATSGSPSNRTGDQFRPVRLKVESLAHLSDKCGIQNAK